MIDGATPGLRAVGHHAVEVKTTELGTFVSDFALGIKTVDAQRPQASNARNGVIFRPGIGPHSEAETVRLVMSELSGRSPEYSDHAIGVTYPSAVRQKCDLCIGASPDWEWAIEIKLLRLFGDNGLPNNNILMHILSPYQQDRSAVTDCEKLINSGFKCRKAVVIYGFDHPDLSMDPAIDAFELLAAARVLVGPRQVAGFGNLIHPVHRAGRVFGWELLGPKHG